MRRGRPVSIRIGISELILMHQGVKDDRRMRIIRFSLQVSAGAGDVCYSVSHIVLHWSGRSPNLRNASPIDDVDEQAEAADAAAVEGEDESRQVGDVGIVALGGKGFALGEGAVGEDVGEFAVDGV